MNEPIKIIIIDDDVSIRKSLAAILEEEGYTVDTAENGKEALEKTDANFYNVALIDIRLPDMEGTDLLAKIKKTTPRMRKIILTGFPCLENSIKALNRGADGYVLKPYDIDKVLTAIKEQVHNQEEERKYSQDKVNEFIVTRFKELNKTVTEQ